LISSDAARRFRKSKHWCLKIRRLALFRKFKKDRPFSKEKNSAEASVSKLSRFFLSPALSAAMILHQSATFERKSDGAITIQCSGTELKKKNFFAGTYHVGVIIWTVWLWQTQTLPN
jgi:hypothetical protein